MLRQRRRRMHPRDSLGRRCHSPDARCRRRIPAGKVERVSSWGWPNEEVSWTWPDVSDGTPLTVKAYTWHGSDVRRRNVLAAPQRATTGSNGCFKAVHRSLHREEWSAPPNPPKRRGSTASPRKSPASCASLRTGTRRSICSSTARVGTASGDDVSKLTASRSPLPPVTSPPSRTRPTTPAPRPPPSRPSSPRVHRPRCG